MTNIVETIQKATYHHLAGRLDQAEELYEQILRDQPENPGVLHSLGTLAYQRGLFDTAVDLLGRAVTADHSISEFHNTLGIALETIGKPQEAIDAYQQAILLRPNFTEAYHNMAKTLLSQDMLAEATQKCERAIQLAPDFAEAYNTLGHCLEKQGRLTQAMDNYRLALKLKPDLAEALNRLGVVLSVQNQHDEAIECYIEAANLEPDYAEAFYNLGFTLAKNGHIDEAIASYQKALQIDPEHAETYNRLGIALNERRRHSEAIKNFRLALKLKPDYIEVYNNLGIALQDQGKYSQAIDEYMKAAKLEPYRAEIYYNLGNAFQLVGHYEEAVRNYGQALKLKPDYAHAYNNLSIALKEQCQFDKAVENCERAIRLEPDCSQFYSNFASILQCQGRLSEAIVNCEHAIALKPDSAEVYCNLASILYNCGRIDEAIDNNRRAIQLYPQYAEAHCNLAIAHLLKGNFKEGWKEFVWRRKTNPYTDAYPHRHKKPRWRGGNFIGKRLLVHCEQGLGDCIQFVRYLPKVKSLGGTVILEARKSLHGLLKNFSSIDEFAELSFTDKTEVRFDVCISLMDLPCLFKTTEDTIPSSVPYLHAEPTKSEYWKEKLNCSDFKIGIVWAGSKRHLCDHHCSCRLEEFAPLAKIKGVRLYGLQKDEPARQAEQCLQKNCIENLGLQIADFTDTAAAIQNMDLIISVDAAILHLAGAMGKPVWALLTFTPDWRWMLSRNDSPWYPTMRLFRQKDWGNWRSVFEEINSELRVLLRR